MDSPALGNPSGNEQLAVSVQNFGLRESARSKGQTLRVFGFQVIAFLLGIALAFM